MNTPTTDVNLLLKGGSDTQEVEEHADLVSRTIGLIGTSVAAYFPIRNKKILAVGKISGYLGQNMFTVRWYDRQSDEADYEMNRADITAAIALWFQVQDQLVIQLPEPAESISSRKGSDPPITISVEEFSKAFSEGFLAQNRKRMEKHRWMFTNHLTRTDKEDKYNVNITEELGDIGFACRLTEDTPINELFPAITTPCRTSSTMISTGCTLIFELGVLSGDSKNDQTEIESRLAFYQQLFQAKATELKKWNIVKEHALVIYTFFGQDYTDVRRAFRSPAFASEVVWLPIEPVFQWALQVSIAHLRAQCHLNGIDTSNILGKQDEECCDDSELEEQEEDVVPTTGMAIISTVDNKRSAANDSAALPTAKRCRQN